MAIVLPDTPTNKWFEHYIFCGAVFNGSFSCAILRYELFEANKDDLDEIAYKMVQLYKRPRPQYVSLAHIDAEKEKAEKEKADKERTEKEELAREAALKERLARRRRQDSDNNRNRRDRSRSRSRSPRRRRSPVRLSLLIFLTSLA